MSNEITLVIDGKSVDFVRKDSVQIPVALGEKRIVVGDRGWVFLLETAVIMMMVLSQSKMHGISVGGGRHPALGNL